MESECGYQKGRFVRFDGSIEVIRGDDEHVVKVRDVREENEISTLIASGAMKDLTPAERDAYETALGIVLAFFGQIVKKKRVFEEAGIEMGGLLDKATEGLVDNLMSVLDLLEAKHNPQVPDDRPRHDE